MISKDNQLVFPIRIPTFPSKRIICVYRSINGKRTHEYSQCAPVELLEHLWQRSQRAEFTVAPVVSVLLRYATSSSAAAASAADVAVDVAAAAVVDVLLLLSSRTALFLSLPPLALVRATSTRKRAIEQLRAPRG